MTDISVTIKERIKTMFDILSIAQESFNIVKYILDNKSEKEVFLKRLITSFYGLYLLIGA